MGRPGRRDGSRGQADADAEPPLGETRTPGSRAPAVTSGGASGDGAVSAGPSGVTVWWEQNEGEGGLY